MTDTLNNIPVSHTDWVDVYSLTSISVGTSLVFQNKGSNSIILVESAVKPSINNVTDGVDAEPHSVCGKMYHITGNPTGLWARAIGSFNGIANVQRA